MFTPLVSCICPTYGRPPAYQHLVEEAIESFLRQTHVNKELIVLNDCAEQELVCDAPGVRVVNVSDRFPTLGDKRNAGVNLAWGNLLAPWDDDDIHLPWRLSLSVERLGDADYFNSRRYWVLDSQGLHFDHPIGVGHNGSLFRRSAFEKVGGYPSISVGEDYEIDCAFLSQVTSVGGPYTGQEELTRREWYYIYRWGVSRTHVSSHGLGENFYQAIGARPIESGRFPLEPHWHRDYEAETRQLVSA